MALVSGMILLVCELKSVTGTLEIVICELCKDVKAEIMLWAHASPKLAVAMSDLCMYEREMSEIDN